jgi:hypothetical protein
LSLIVLPGPGLIVTAAGLALMASDVGFARRWLHAVRRRLPEGEDGTIESWVIVSSFLMFVVSLGASMWWTFLRQLIGRRRLRRAFDGADDVRRWGNSTVWFLDHLAWIVAEVISRQDDLTRRQITDCRAAACSPALLARGR